VANFAPAVTVTITTSASPSVGGITSGGGTFNSGASVTVGAAANAGTPSLTGRRAVRSSAPRQFTPSPPVRTVPW
jgi:hypothetical protein